MRLLARLLVLLEVVVCFLPVTALWMIGTFFTALAVIAGGTRSSSDPRSWLGPLWLIGSELCGLCGLVALGFLLVALFRTPPRIKRPTLALVGIALGALPIVPFVFLPGWLKAYALAPLACAAHLVYLAKGMLFARARRPAPGHRPNTLARRAAHETGVRGAAKDISGLRRPRPASAARRCSRGLPCKP
jgi:hypothetical protein